MGIPPGWYADPAEPTTQRYWDGQQWIKPQTQQAQPSAGDSAQTTAQISGYIAELSPLRHRLGARIVDLGVLVLLNVIVNGYFIWQYLDEMIPVLSAASRRYLADGNIGDISVPGRAQRLLLVITMIALLLWLAYEVPGVVSSGQTLGKRLLNIRVISLATGENPRFRPAFRRWAVFALPLVFPMLCALPLMAVNSAWCMWDRPARQCLHDKLGQTIVVRAGRE